MAVRVLYTLNEGFLRPTLTSLFSLVKATPAPVEITIMPFKLSDASLARLEAVATAVPGNSFRVVDLDPEFLADPSVPEKKKPNLAKLLSPRLLSGRVLFLDGDTLVRKDLREIYETDLGDSLVAACRNLRALESVHVAAKPSFFVSRKEAESAAKSVARIRRDTALSDPAEYVNSGVMLMDLDRMRAEPELVARFSDYRHAAKHSPPTQSIIGQTLAGRVAFLHPRWNVYSNAARAHYECFPPEQRAQYRDAVRDPGVVHFVGRAKPWQAFQLRSLSGGLRWRRAYRALERELGLARAPAAAGP